MQKHRDKKRCENAREIMDGEWDPVPERAWTQLPALHCSPAPAALGSGPMWGCPPAHPPACWQGQLFMKQAQELSLPRSLSKARPPGKTRWQENGKPGSSWDHRAVLVRGGSSVHWGTSVQGPYSPFPLAASGPRIPEPPWWSSDFP